jgi:Citrate lyase beta subunit
MLMSDVELRRTQLATPASDVLMMESAADSAADEVFLDLEDSVAPNAKVDARDPLIQAAVDHDWSDKILSYRINGIDTRWWYDDIIEVIGQAGEFIDDIIVPKVRPRQMSTRSKTCCGKSRGTTTSRIGGIGLEPQIEDGEGMHNVHEIANSTDRLSSVIFGPGDYSAAMGTPGLDIGQFPEYPGHYWHHALSEVNAAAKSAGVPALDGPYADIQDPDGFRDSAERANMIGCDGKWAIHPSQIEIANEVFAPDPEVADRAKRIVDAYAEAMEEGKGAVSVDGQMVDEATNKMAQEIAEKARAADLIE